jgi:dTDP-4-dehydrorhamnose 3,5-epimerase
MLKLIEGGMEVDERGTVSFVNNFDLSDTKRFYIVENHQKNYLRAWKGHMREAKYVYPVSGTAIVGVVNLETEEMQRIVLSSKKPRILYIPPGHANGFKALTDDTRLLFFSTCTLEESFDDEILFAYTKWDID